MLSTCLWFDTQAEEAANFYVGIFPNSKVGKISRYPDSMPSGQGPDASRAGQVLTGYTLSSANQEHGILSRQPGPDPDIATRFPIGTQLRILPNHACATGAQYPYYQALAPDGTLSCWPRLQGW